MARTRKTAVMIQFYAVRFLLVLVGKRSASGYRTSESNEIRFGAMHFVAFGCFVRPSGRIEAPHVAGSLRADDQGRWCHAKLYPSDSQELRQCHGPSSRAALPRLDIKRRRDRSLDPLW